jgi:7-cyano-7-deazaguanine synthase in queuosine biosynthesis
MIEVHCEGQHSLTLREQKRHTGNYISQLRLSFGRNELESAVARDLLRVGEAAFLADRAFRRGKSLGQQTRSLRVSLPVEEPERWTDVKDRVVQLAEFVSQDHWEFEFTPLKRSKARRRRQPRPFLQNAAISLFSNGLDSLCGAAAAFDRGETPVFVSHSPPGVKYVRLKVKALQDELGCAEVGPQFINLYFRAIARDARGRRNMFPERTRRTRPMLFLSLAGAAAVELGVPKIYLNENGVLAINLPFQANQHGYNVTRHAHPETLRRFESLLRALWPFDAEPTVSNPFSDLTKGEEIKYLRQAAHLAEETVTCPYAGQQVSTLIGWLKRQHCAHVEVKECGLCYSCLIRRSAMETAEVRESEGHYAFDARRVFRDPEAYSNAPLYRVVKQNPKALYNFCQSILKMEPGEFVFSYLYDLTLLPRSPEDVGQSALAAYRLYRRFARQFIKYLEA